MYVEYGAADVEEGISRFDFSKPVLTLGTRNHRTGNHGPPHQLAMRLF
jgi:hypothetical protein